MSVALVVTRNAGMYMRLATFTVKDFASYPKPLGKLRLWRFGLYPLIPSGREGASRVEEAGSTEPKAVHRQIQKNDKILAPLLSPMTRFASVLCSRG